MSLILDALKRAEAQRASPVPTILHTQALVIAPARRWWPWVSAALLVLCVAGGLGWHYEVLPGGVLPVTEAGSGASVASSTASSAASLGAHQQAARDVVEKPLPVHSAAPASVQSVPASEPAVAALYAEAKVAVAAGEIEQLYAAEPSAEPETASLSIVSPFAEAEPVAALPERLNQPARYLSSVTDAPLFDDLPWAQKLGVPSIGYARHDYLAGGTSSVVINGETRSVGNLVAAGQFIVEDILADGVVLRQGNLRFKLKALNGWVNM